jgi:hypothetical protein
MNLSTGSGQTLIKQLSAALFGLVLISFGLQSVGFSIAEVPVASVTSAQLVTGAPLQDVAMPRVRTIASLFSRVPSVEASVHSIVSNHVGGIPSISVTVLVMRCAIGGLCASFLRSRKSARLPLAVAAVALVVLTVLRVGLDQATLRQGMG